METFSALPAFCAGYSPVTGEFPTQRPVTRSFDVFFIFCTWISDWANDREAEDLRRHCAHYDVTIMYRSRACFIIRFMSSQYKSVKNMFCFYAKTIPIRSHFVHATTTKVWWHGQNCDCIGSLEWKYEQDFNCELITSLCNESRGLSVGGWK